MGYGIDVGASAVKVVAVRRTLRGFKVVGATRKRLAKAPTPEDAKKTAGKMLAEALGRASGRVGVVGLSGRDINLRVVQQPATTAVNYRQMMFYEVDQARGTEGQLYADYVTLREPDAYTPQYLAMVGIGKSSYVDERLAMAASAGVDVRDAVPNCFALYTAYRNSYGREGGTVLLLDVGADTMEMVLVYGGRMIFARNVSQGARTFDASVAGMAGVTPEEAEARKIQYGTLGPAADGADPREEDIRPAIRTAASQLSGIINSSIQFAKTQLADKDLVIDKIYISGGGARLKGLPEYLQSSLKVPVEALDPFKNVDTSFMADVEEFKQLPTDLACPLGLAQLAETTTGRTSLSILPEPMKKRRKFYQGPVFVAVGGVVVAAAMLIVTVIAYVRKSSQEKARDEFTAKTADLNNRIAKMTELEKAQREAAGRADQLLSRQRNGRAMMDVIQKLRRALPEGVNVRKLELFDLAKERRDGVPRLRGLFHAAGVGLVIGEIAKVEQNGATIIMRSGEKYEKAAREGYEEWDAPTMGIGIDGEIDENISGGPGAALQQIKKQLEDASRGMTAEIEEQRQLADKPGWRMFRIVIRFE